MNLDYTNFLNMLAALFLLIACGFIIRKAKIVGEVDTKRFSSLVLKVAQPLMIFAALSTADPTVENLKKGLIVMGFGFLSHVLMAALAYLFCKAIRHPDERKITEFALIFTNTGFIGFPIMASLFGESEGSFLAAFYVISFHLFLWSWGIAVLGRGRDDIKLTPKKIFFNFGSVPCYLGVLVFLAMIPLRRHFQFEMPSAIVTFMNYLGQMCTPLSALITGALLATRSAKQVFGSLRIWILSFIKLIVIPLIICVVCGLICRLIGLDPMTYGLFCTVEAALPCAATITMLCELYDMDSGYASQLVGMTALLSAGTLPLVLIIARWILQLL